MSEWIDIKKERPPKGLCQITVWQPAYDWRDTDGSIRHAKEDHYTTVADVYNSGYLFQMDIEDESGSTTMKNCTEKIFSDGGGMFVTHWKPLDDLAPLTDEIRAQYTPPVLTEDDTDELNRKLKHCPFCGGKPHLEENEGDWLVACPKCGMAFIPQGDEPGATATAEMTVKSWNNEQFQMWPPPAEGEDVAELLEQAKAFEEYRKQKRNWENAFQKWSNEASQDGTSPLGCCGYGTICDYCEDNDKGRPCVRALNAKARAKNIRIDYTDRDFAKWFYL